MRGVVVVAVGRMCVSVSDGGARTQKWSGCEERGVRAAPPRGLERAGDGTGASTGKSERERGSESYNNVVVRHVRVCLVVC